MSKTKDNGNGLLALDAAEARQMSTATRNNVLQVGPRPGAPAAVVEALRVVARHFDGDRGIWAYDCFDAINATYFEGLLPTPKIQWSLTPHGGCLGLTRMTSRPVITLHPSLLGGTERRNPWDVDPAWLGFTYAFDVLLHESIHVSQHCLHGGGRGPTSHNNTAWIAEVNRLIPLLGFGALKAGRSKAGRVPVEGATTTTGKPATRVARVSEGDIPFGAVARFPYSLRLHLDTADAHYRAGRIPVTDNSVLQEIA
jgi:hypothetical protein